MSIKISRRPELRSDAGLEFGGPQPAGVTMTAIFSPIRDFSKRCPMQAKVTGANGNEGKVHE